MNIIDIIQSFILAVVTEAVTEILVDAKITEGLRGLVFRKANPDFEKELNGKEPKPGPFVWRFLSDLLSCGYCTSVWVAAVAALAAPRWFDWWVVNWLIMVFMIHRASNFLHVVFSLVKKGRVKTYDIELVHKYQVHNGSDGQVGGQESPEA